MEKELDLWAEQDLLQLEGSSESLRIEFKSSKLLLKNENDAITDLCKHVSAFANTEGGIVFIGIKERREKGKKADIAGGIDEGIDPGKMPTSRLQRLIESNISPYLPGIRFYPIPLSGAKDGRFVYILSVPKGTTAYQSNKDKLYYGRSEFEAKALPDHVIRLLIMRGKVAQAQVQADFDTAYGKYVKPIDNKSRISFDLKIINTGDITIHDFLLSLRLETTMESCLRKPVSFIHGEEAVIQEVDSLEENARDSYSANNQEIMTADNVRKYAFTMYFIRRPSETIMRPGRTYKGSLISAMQMQRHLRGERFSRAAEGAKIFPNDFFTFPGPKWLYESASSDDMPILHWNLYLDNAPRCSGQIELVKEAIAAGIKT